MFGSNSQNVGVILKYPIAFGIVFLAKKNGGFNDGTLYALKTINITQAIELDDITPVYIDPLSTERRVNEYFGFDLNDADRFAFWIVIWFVVRF